MTQLLALDAVQPVALFDGGVTSAELVIGSRSLQKLAPAIRELRCRCHQGDDLVTDIDYFLAANTQKNRRVGAVLIRRDLELEACVLFFEHCRLGIGLGIWRGGDSVGDGLVVGAADFRMHYVDLASRAVLGHWRAHGVSLSVNAPADVCREVMGADHPSRMFSARSIQRQLPLESTYAAMLAGVGRSTRRSLVKKRQQLEERERAIFVSALDQQDALDAMLQLQERSLPARTRAFYCARHGLLRDNPGMFCMGIHTPAHGWLSLLSGWRHENATYLDLQMNDKHFKKESLSAVMRAFMLEFEIQCGQRLIHFVGGTSMMLRRYCRPSEPCTDIFLWKPGLRASLFKTLIPRLMQSSVYERIRTGSDGLTLSESDECP